MPSTEPWRNPRPAPNLDEVRNRMTPKPMLPSWLRAWGPALVWAVVIFFLSTDTFSSEHTSLIVEPLLRWLFPAISQDSLDLVHHLVRKSAHFTEYFIFFLLIYRGFRRGRREWHWSWAFGAWFIAAAYSALDEIHQSFEVYRTASAWDSLLDSSGALVAFFVVFFVHLLRRLRSTRQ
jgi:VanZ family protein